MLPGEAGQQIHLFTAVPCPGSEGDRTGTAAIFFFTFREGSFLRSQKKYPIKLKLNKISAAVRSAPGLFLCGKEQERSCRFCMHSSQFVRAAAEKEVKMKPTVFEEKLICCLRIRSGGCLEAESAFVPVNNRPEARVLKLQLPGCQLMPLVYTEEYEERFRQGEKLETLADEILERVRQSGETEALPRDFFREYDQVADQIYCRVISAEKNAALLKKVPCEIHENLAIVYYYELQKYLIRDAEASILIRREHLELWDCPEDTLRNRAWKNTLRKKPVKFCRLSEIFNELGVDLDDETEENTLHILTTCQGGFGAVAAFYPGVLADCAARIRSDLILLPSSIHEWLLLPADWEKVCREREELRSMVQEINRTQVAEKEVLSDDIYFYQAAEDRIRRM